MLLFQKTPGRVLVLKNQEALAVVLQKLSDSSVKVLALQEPEKGQVSIAGTSVFDVQVLLDVSFISSSRLDVDIAAIVLGRQAAVSAAAKKLKVKEEKKSKRRILKIVS